MAQELQWQTRRSPPPLVTLSGGPPSSTASASLYRRTSPSPRLASCKRLVTLNLRNNRLTVEIQVSKSCQDPSLVPPRNSTRSPSLTTGSSLYSYDTVANGFSARLTPAEAQALMWYILPFSDGPAPTNLSHIVLGIGGSA